MKIGVFTLPTLFEKETIVLIANLGASSSIDIMIHASPQFGLSNLLTADSMETWFRRL